MNTSLVRRLFRRINGFALDRRSEPPARHADPTTRARLQALADSVPKWWHSIDLGHGVTTPGFKTPAVHQQELRDLRLPDLRGKSVLDVGAWDGFYSFEAERRGARRVVALDHFAWFVDPLQSDAHARYTRLSETDLREAAEQGSAGSLPGKKGFDAARSALNSQVETVVGDFMTLDLVPLGTFDVVLFLGVLYHMKDPFQALRRLAEITDELAVIETAAVVVSGMEDRALCEFYETTELGGDPTNWWAPNAKALVGMARAAGFRRVEITSPPISKWALRRGRVFHRRLHAHAWK